MESNQQHIHSFEHIVVPATCSQRGYTLHRCACGYEHKDQFTPQSQHTFALVEEIEPGCTADGFCKTRCTQCGQEQVTPIPAVGHSWGAWSIQKYATCTENGVQMRPCTRCDARDERPIPASGHKIVSEKRNGVDEYYCANCGQPMEKPAVAPVVETVIQPPREEPVPQNPPTQPQNNAKAPAKAKKGKWKIWLIIILAVVLLLTAAVSAVYIIKPDFYYDFIDEHPFFDFFDDNNGKTNRKDDDDDDDDDEKDKNKGTTPKTDETSVTEGADSTQGTGAVQPAPSEPTMPSSNTVVTNVPIGAELSEPEVVFDIEHYDTLQFTITVQNDTQTVNIEMAYIRYSDETAVYYMAQGANAAVIERTADGLILYNKVGNTFVRDTMLSQEELQQTLSQMEQIIAIFADYVNLFNGATYRKAEVTGSYATGPVFAYEVIKDGQLKAEICTDCDNGMLIYMKNLENGAVMTVTSYETLSVQLPAYK